jgi:hypothetical protein
LHKVLRAAGLEICECRRLAALQLSTGEEDCSDCGFHIMCLACSCCWTLQPVCLPQRKSSI